MVGFNADANAILALSEWTAALTLSIFFFFALVPIAIISMFAFTMAINADRVYVTLFTFVNFTIRSAVLSDAGTVITTSILRTRSSIHARIWVTSRLYAAWCPRTPGNHRITTFRLFAKFSFKLLRASTDRFSVYSCALSPILTWICITRVVPQS